MAFPLGEARQLESCCCCCCCFCPPTTLPQQPCPVGVSPFTEALSEKRTFMLMNSNLHPVTTHKKMGSSGKAANYTSAHQPHFSQESRTSPEWGCLQRAPRAVGRSQRPPEHHAYGFDSSGIMRELELGC
ncbi:hypothetical protein D4764_16G0008090 [Takifugu flavidus]|uniref:Uncharacterized protein n=1 Tax=Takifugu flavidus TaxID=433684 RepID=A0A5C6NXU3_9TELE|nr:hypothetical protein D4764_16G0008090 [Takifugu flavidus]